jgi:hypothetical protein
VPSCGDEWSEAARRKLVLRVSVGQLSLSPMHTRTVCQPIASVENTWNCHHEKYDMKCVASSNQERDKPKRTQRHGCSCPLLG